MAYNFRFLNAYTVLKRKKTVYKILLKDKPKPNLTEYKFTKPFLLYGQV